MPPFAMARFIARKWSSFNLPGQSVGMVETTAEAALADASLGAMLVADVDLSALLIGQYEYPCHHPQTSLLISERDVDAP
jgi:hypothetical protein